MPPITSVKYLPVTLDQEMDSIIQCILELECKQRQFNSYDDQWHDIEIELDDLYQQVGYWVVYDYKQSPF